MIKAIIFDCFGVLYGGSLEMLASMAPPEKRQTVHDVNIAKDYGYINYQEYLAQLAELTGVTTAEVVSIITKHHIPNREMITYAEQLKERYKTALLSNIGNSQIEDLFDGRVEEKFGEVILSYKLGLAKPNPEIFIYAAKHLGVAPEECVMIDDIATNCESAQVVGMHSIQYTSNDATIEKLQKLLEG